MAGSVERGTAGGEGAGDPPRRLHDECDRVGRRAHPPGGRGRRAPFPMSRPLDVRLHGDHVLDPTGKGQARWTMRWRTALNAFDITFDGPLSAARQYLSPAQLHRSFTPRACSRCSGRLVPRPRRRSSAGRRRRQAVRVRRVIRALPAGLGPILASSLKGVSGSRERPGMKIKSREQLQAVEERTLHFTTRGLTATRNRSTQRTGGCPSGSRNLSRSGTARRRPSSRPW